MFCVELRVVAKWGVLFKGKITPQNLGYSYVSQAKVKRI